VPLPPSGSGGAGVTPAEIGLTERQAQVLALLARGLSNREIAAHLELSEGTVKIHVTAILKALGVASRTQALIAVTRYGIDLESVF
jgi:DNA-binding NarL/FixJ family response regulator